MDVQKFLEPTVDVKRLVEILDGLGHEGRVHTTRTWSKKEMSRIFDAVKGHHPIDLDHVVPVSEPLVEVQHDLHNALGLPGHFQKRFAKVASDSAIAIGFNVQPFTFFAGPGYFTAAKGEGDHEGEVVIEYTKIPKDKAPGWPKIEDNGGFGPGIVFGGMTDYLRGITSHVSIGQAFKGGKSRGEWFALVRRDPS